MVFKALFYVSLSRQSTPVHFPQMETYVGTSTCSVCRSTSQSKIICPPNRISSLISRSEFAKIFEPYGTVTHAVILATLDSASRRRGFIVMSTHQEAKAAMDTLSRTHIGFSFNLLVV